MIPAACAVVLRRVVSEVKILVRLCEVVGGMVDRVAVVVVLFPCVRFPVACLVEQSGAAGVLP